MNDTAAVPAEADARILVVDDEPANVQLLLRFLRRAGYEDVAGTSDPSEGLAWWLLEPPDLVLLDQRMPGLNGLTLVGKAAEALGTLPPVFLLSGEVTPELEEQARAAGAAVCIEKPFDYHELIARISQTLAEARIPPKTR